MAVTIAATLAGLRTPSLVQVDVEGVSIGDSVVIQGVAGSSVWTLRGGSLTATSTQVIALDDLTPPNRPVTYQVVVNGTVAATTAPITVTNDKDYLLSSIDGLTVVPVFWVDTGDARRVRVDKHLTWVAGRRNPVVRYAAAGSTSGRWVFRTQTADATQTLLDLIESGAPLLLRTSGLVHDIETVQTVTVADDVDLEGYGVGVWRRWSLPWTQIDDPLAATAVPGDTFATIDAAYPGTTFAELDGAYSGTTFGDWNRKAWASGA